MRALAVPLTSVLLLLAAGACGSSTAPDGELYAARSRWARQHAASYDITVFRSCECSPEMSGPVVVAVRDGVVAGRTYVATGAAVGTDMANLFPSVDGLFAVIVDARDRHAVSLTADYDSVYGFPATISIDYQRPMVDDEITWHASNFERR